MLGLGRCKRAQLGVVIEDRQEGFYHPWIELLAAAAP
jgi:hypothetical protein